MFSKILMIVFAGLASIILVARYDYWALIICNGLPFINLDQKTIIASIPRIRIKMEHLIICLIYMSNTVQRSVKPSDR